MSDIVISVICQTYNHEKYIRNCLDGFVNQRTSYKYEVLINDDASTDRTPMIIKEYEKKYPTIIKAFYQTENQYSKGKSIFRDILKPYTKGKYIAFCEGDDYWCDEGKLQTQIEFLEHHPEYSGIVHNTRIVDENNKGNELCFYGKTRDIESLNSMLDFPHTSSYVLRNPFIQTVPDLRQAAESISYWDKSYALYMMKTGKIRYIDNIMSCYRYISNSGTSYQARMKRSNMTEMKIGAELSHYTQIKKYALPIDLAPHYYRNVCDYALRFYINNPSNENKRLLNLAFEKSPFSTTGFFLYEIKNIPHNILLKIKSFVKMTLFGGI